LHIAAEIAKALRDRRPVVALESALLTHGLPEPANWQALTRQEAAVRASGAVPGVVAVCDGRVLVGAGAGDLQALARHDPAKVTTWNLAAVVTAGGWGATTVAATIQAAAEAGIQVISTGGIGGVHPGAAGDVSADLTALARHPVTVVCSGPKSIVDPGRTLEYLETEGIPVIGWQTSFLPGFFRRTTGLPLAARADSLGQIAQLLRLHWRMAPTTGVVVVQEAPEALAIPDAEFEAARAVAQAQALAGRVQGAAVTPELLGGLRQVLGPRLVTLNLALLEANATLAGSLAAEVAQLQ
jgi:pseudouridine-5'-phosphate glycosidase